MNKTLILRGEMRLDGNVIHLNVDNLIQQQNLNAFKEELMEFLRAELQNYSITLESTIKTQETESKRMYTSQEKFKHLLDEYPILEKLKSEFGLEAKF